MLGRIAPAVAAGPPSSARSPRRHVEALSHPAADASTRCCGSLSGGNQQKVALAKWLTWPPKVLVLSEPTRGMDVGAKEDVVSIVRGLRDQGLAVVVVSTEPETVLSLADRIVVMKKGRIVREFAGETVSKDRLLRERPDGRAGRCAALPAQPDAQHRAVRDADRAGGLLRLASPSFATLDNAANILTQISVTGIIAVGLTFVILCAEIDLSVAAIANATGIVVAYFTLQETYVNIANVPLPGCARRSCWRCWPAPSSAWSTPSA